MNEHEGWIKLHRKTLDNPVCMKDAEYFAVWCWLLLNASYTPETQWFKGKKIELKEGQILTTLDEISRVLRIKQSKVVRILNLLKNEKQIEKQTSNRNTLISVVNWEKFQSSEKQNGKLAKTERKTSEKPVENLPIIKEYKEYKEYKEGGVGGEQCFCYATHSNVQNLDHVISNHIHVDSEYIQADEELYRCLREWMEYKDGKQPKTQHHYGTEIGIKKLITSFYKAYTEYGIAKVIQVVDYSISNNYSGVIWNKLKEQNSNNSYMDAVRDRVSMVDDWV